MAGFFSVKNFVEFQHYKDRAPPWIKLYNNLLDDYEFGCLQDASKLHLVLIWLLASRMNNRIPADPDWIGQRINANSPVQLTPLFNSGFIIMEQPASNLLATRLQLARPEREGETETETENTTLPREAINQW